MKKISTRFTGLLFAILVAMVGIGYAQVNQGTLLAGLINANVNIGDVTVSDVIDVENVLNDNQIDILNNSINNNPIASNNQDVLTNLLRDANVITDNQVVVGVLSGQYFVLNQ